MRDELRLATTMAQLADAACPLDEDYARGLFRYALSKAAAGQNDDAKLIAAKNTANNVLHNLLCMNITVHSDHQYSI
jgi:hypothetical protein